METVRDPRRWLVLVVLCLSTLVLVVDNMALAVAIPPLTEELDATAQDIQWILDSYILVFAGLLLTSGSLSDRFGRRRVMIIGLALFGLASLVATFAADPGQLIAARVVMGVGGALVMPSTLSILITVFDDSERRKAMTAWSAVAMVGLVGGPVLGGALIAWFWWGAVFLINVPIAVFAIVAAVWLMPESKGPWQKPDPLGAVLSAVGMTALVWSIIELPKTGLAHPGTVASFGVAILALVGFVLWQRRNPAPLVPLSLFRDRAFSGGSVALTLVQVGNGGLLLVLTQYLQFVLGYIPTEAGLAFLPMAIASLTFNTIGATLGSRISNRALAVTGLTVVATGFAVLTTLSAGDGIATLAVALAVIGAGGGLAMPAITTALMGAVPARHAGVGSALNDTIQQAGAALGVAVLGSIVAGAFTRAMPAEVPDAARRSIADAVALADPGLVGTAREAYTTAMGVAFTAAAAGVFVAAVLTFVIMRPRRAATPNVQPTAAEALDTVTVSN